MKKLLLFFLAALLLLSAGCAKTPEAPETEPTAPAQQETPPPSETSAPAQPQLAPDFTVYDREGNAVTLSSFRGKPVVLNFWTSWCGPCQGEMPEFDALYQELGGEVTFLMINVTTSEQNREAPEKFIAEQGYTFPVYYDLEGTASSAYGISAFPTTFFVGPQGEAAAYAVGAINSSLLRKGIDMAREGN